MNNEKHNLQIRNRYKQNPEVRKQKADYYKEYIAIPEVKARKRAYQKEYYNRPEVKERTKVRKRIWARMNRKRPYVKERISKRNKTKHYKLKEIVFSHYGKYCNCCGETIPQFLTVDHVNNDGNLHRQKMKTSGGIALYREIIQLGFPNTFQILCMSCNFGKKVNGGVCPHKDILYSITGIK